MDGVSDYGDCVFFYKVIVMGIVEKFSRKLAEVCGDDFYDKLDEELHRANEEATENSKKTEEIMALLKGKRAEQAKIILSNVRANIAKKQMDMRI